MLTRISDSKEMAEKAVADGDNTLKKANNTYHLLQSFSSEVQKSSENAKVALEDVPSISQQIRDTEDIIRKAEYVTWDTAKPWVVLKWFSFQALQESHNNANNAKANAQDAQERYADQASKVSGYDSTLNLRPDLFVYSKDAEAIRKNANDAKNEALTLHQEANSLRSRIGSTESRFGKLEELADKDDVLTEAAKAKVGQAKTDSEEVQKQMQKALDSIKSIIGELENMKEISIQDLDLLGN